MARMTSLSTMEPIRSVLPQDFTYTVEGVSTPSALSVTTSDIGIRVDSEVTLPRPLNPTAENDSGPPSNVLAKLACPDCNRPYKNKRDMDRHISTNHTPHQDRRRFYCTVEGCRKKLSGYAREDALKRHQEEHIVK